MIILVWRGIRLVFLDWPSGPGLDGAAVTVCCFSW
jgi:hypothetical protein